MKLLLVLSIITFAWARDNRVEICGQYEIEGKLIEKEKLFQFIVNEKSEAEVKINLGSSIPKETHDYIDRRINSYIEITSPCRYRCQGKMIKVLNLVPYHRQARIFLPERRLYKKSKCLAK